MNSFNNNAESLVKVEVSESDSYASKASKRVIADSCSHDACGNSISSFERLNNKCDGNDKNTSLNEKDMKLLRSLVTDYNHVGKDPGPGTLKCHICSLLRQYYPYRFPDTSSMQELLKMRLMMVL